MKMKKRIFDLLVGIPVYFAVSPLLIFAAALIFLKQGTPIFFKQMRSGLHGKFFTLYKLCTMTNCCDEKGRLLPDSQRITSLGKVLRAASLDELPELINVIKGDISIVGPRPLLIQYLDRYTSEQARRHKVKPGITGWAQVNGRNALSWEQKFAHDLWYVDHQSLFLDMRILAMTIKNVLKLEGISHPGQATMEEFMGSDG